MSLVKLFFVFAKIAILTFGGGYAMVPLFENELVRQEALLTADEFANLVGLAQVTPGPIGFNAATYVGQSQGGLLGALVASAGVVLPSLVLSLVVAVTLRKAADAQWMKLLMKGVRPCVVGIIAAAVFFFADTSVFTVPFADMVRGRAFGICWQGAVIFALVILIRRHWPKTSPIWALLLSGVLGAVLL